MFPGCLQDYSRMIISNESMDLNDPKEFADPQVFNDPKGISIRTMDFYIPKVYGETSILDSLVEKVEPPAFDT